MTIDSQLTQVRTRIADLKASLNTVQEQLADAEKLEAVLAPQATPAPAPKKEGK